MRALSARMAALAIFFLSVGFQSLVYASDQPSQPSQPPRPPVYIKPPAATVTVKSREPGTPPPSDRVHTYESQPRVLTPQEQIAYLRVKNDQLQAENDQLHMLVDRISGELARTSRTIRNETSQSGRDRLTRDQLLVLLGELRAQMESLAAGLQDGNFSRALQGIVTPDLVVPDYPTQPMAPKMAPKCPAPAPRLDDQEPPRGLDPGRTQPTKAKKRR